MHGRLYGSRKRVYRIIVSSAKSILCASPWVALYLEQILSRTWEFNGSEIRTLKTARSHKRTNQSGIKPNNRGPRNWFAATAAVARWYWLMSKRVSIPRERYTSPLPLNYLIAETRQIWAFRPGIANCNWIVDHQSYIKH